MRYNDRMTNDVATLRVYFVASNSRFSASLKLMTFQIALRYYWRVSDHSLTPDDKETYVGLDVVILFAYDNDQIGPLRTRSNSPGGKRPVKEQ